MSPDMIFNLLSKALMQTLQMVFVAGIVGSIIGLPIGVFLATSGKGELFPAPATNRVLGLIVNAARSTPFIILVVAIVPLTRLLTGTSIGTWAAIVPLTIATIPFFARLVESAIREVDKGLIEAARAMGATPFQIFRHVTLPMLKPVLITIIIFRTIDTLKVFDIIFGTTGGGPLRATESVQTLAYQTAFKSYKFGESAAIAVVFSLIILTLCIIYLMIDTDDGEKA